MLYTIYDIVPTLLWCDKIWFEANRVGKGPTEGARECLGIIEFISRHVKMMMIHIHAYILGDNCISITSVSQSIYRPTSKKASLCSKQQLATIGCEWFLVAPHISNILLVEVLLNPTSSQNPTFKFSSILGVHTQKLCYVGIHSF
jgi:hypothetical protein